MSDRPDVHTILREAAALHQPDRDRIRARVTDGMRPGVRPVPRTRAWHTLPSWTPMAGAAAGLVAVLAVGTVTVDWAVRDPAEAVTSSPGPGSVGTGDPAERDTRTPATPSGTGAETSASRTAPADSSPSTSGASTPGPGASGRAAPTRDGHLRAEGAVGPQTDGFWGEDRVTLRTGEPLTSLTLELRIDGAGGVKHAEEWQTVPDSDLNISVREENGALVYRWTLRNGVTLQPGTHVFAAQFTHGQGERGVQQDAYTASGKGPAGSVTVSGGIR